ncbi:MAG: magnesium transporter CorA family protein [Anaerostipes sp.]|nr:magnesium transporter CorA family protein [Anaerostipes sp.]
MYRIYKSYNDKDDVVEIDIIEKESWVSMTDPSAAELQYVSDRYHIDLDDLRAPLDEEERSRLEYESDYTMILVNIPVVRNEDGSKRYETIPLGIFITDKVVFTVCLEETNILKQFIDGLVPKFYTYMKTRFVYQILYHNASLFLYYLRMIDQRANQIEEILHETSKNKDLIQLYDLEKCLVYFTTSLKSNEVVLEKLRKHIGLRYYEEDQELLEDVIIENKQAMEMTDIYHNILRNTMSLFSSIIDNNLNQVMKFLAAITIVLELPTMISGLYGMNVNSVGMPFSSSPYGFGIIFLITVAICTVAFAILKRKNLL